MIAAASNAKYQVALSVAYGAGLRANEVCTLKVTNIDSERMTLRVEQGKGRKDRYALLSPVLLERLRAWWRVGHAQGKLLPNGWAWSSRIWWPATANPRLANVLPITLLPSVAAVRIFNARPCAARRHVPGPRHRLQSP